MIGKYLDICTSHLTQETVDDLAIGNIIGVFVNDYEEGIVISVPDDTNIEVPKDLDTLFEYARQNDITLIRLDRDGEESEELPIYEWN